MGVSAWQLFRDGHEEIPARWPNANFNDGSVFNVSHNWAAGSMNRDTQFINEFPWKTYPYEDGELIDAGSLDSNYQNHPSLLRSGINPVGKIAVLNVGGTRTWSRKINTFNETTGGFGFRPISDDNSQWMWKNENHFYFLEQGLDLIDVPGEWYFDDASLNVYYMVGDQEDPNSMNVRVKTQAYGMICEDSKGRGVNQVA